MPQDQDSKTYINSGEVKSITASGRPSLKGRLLTASVPAAAITCGLFVLMNGMIQVDDVPEEIGERRVLGVVTPQQQEQNDLIVRTRVVEIDQVDLPPPPVRQTVARSDVHLPPIEIAGSAPKLPSAAGIINVMTGPVAIGNRVVQPIRSPILSYPRIAAERGIEGSCEVHFSVSIRGEPFNIDPVCTDAVFEREAKRAVAQSEFLPKVQDGRSVEQTGVTYPLVFELEQ